MNLFNSRSFKFVAYMLLLITIGTIGFFIIGGDQWSIIDSLYMTLITLSTVGFSEVHPLDESGRVWAMILIIFGVSGFAYVISQFGTELLEFGHYRSRKMKKHIEKLENHYIVCGYGRMGAVIAAELSDKEIPFVVIENNESKIEKVQEKGYNFIYDDATLEETLLEAGIKSASGVVVTLNTDQDNLFVTMSVRTLNTDAFLVSRYSMSDTAAKLTRAGANKVVNPYVAGGHKMSELLISPFLEDSVSIRTPHQNIIDLAIDEMKIKNIPKYDGVSIKESGLREEFHVSVVGIVDEDGNVSINPKPDTVMQKSHTVMLIGEKEHLIKLLDSLDL